MENWQNILHKAGYPTTALTLDFETYFDDEYNLKKMSTVEYVCDDRFEILGLGYQDLEPFSQIEFLGPKDINWYFQLLKDQYSSNFDKITIIGQNLKFDALILREHFGITPRYTVDIRDLSRHLDARNKHSLEALAKRWGAPKLKGDTKQFKNYHWNDLQAAQHWQNGMWGGAVPEKEKLEKMPTTKMLEEYCKNDIEIETFLFKKLLPMITNPQIELPLATQTLHLYLNPQIEIDFELGKKLKKEMRAEMLKPLKDLYDLGIDCSEQEISGDISFLTLLNQHLDQNEQVPMKPGKNEMIPALAREDEGMKYLLEKHHNKKVRALAAARLAISSWPLHIKRVQNLMNQAKMRGGKIGAPLTYYASHTGRWGGTEGINLQNLGGRGRGGQGTHPLIQQTRQMVCAPDGYIFGIPDYRQIEARILAWLAGQDDLTQSFAEDRSPYAEFATELFQCSVRKPKEDDPEPLKSILAIKYGFGKDAILGCGYGMGSLKFYDRCRANSDLRPAFDSGEYDWDFINGLIKTYRRKYSKIPEFWKVVEKAWKFVTKYPGQIQDYFVSGKTISVQYMNIPCVKFLEPILKFYNQNDTTTIQLPSGRCLFYPKASVNNRGDLLYRWGKLWGGSITENIVQAVARDILGEVLLQLENEGFNILLHVHDEIVCLLSKPNADKELQQMIEIMEVVPDWARGLPIAVEGKLSEKYKK